MSERSPRTVGSVIGRYVLYDEIASGGTATIHLGRLLGSAGFARTVAVKCLHPGMTKDPEFVSMLLDEAHLASRVRHPNVVQTLDVVSEAGDIFLVMEYVHGESLARLVQRAAASKEPLPLPVTVAVCAGMLFGLHAAHEATSEDGSALGIVHRDVSPQNVLVGADGVARVLDFGVAKAASRLQSTGNGQVKGKLRYMAPEQLKSRPIDRRTDVFAASCVLWECLTSRRLFDGPDPGAIVTKILMHEVPAPSRLAPGVPEALDTIALRGLSADPRGRFATARDMAIALERAIPPATAREVGEWLEHAAGDVLEKRAARVAAIEGKSGSAAAPGRAARAEEPTAPLAVGEASDAPGLLDETGTAKISDAVVAELDGTSSTSPGRGAERLAPAASPAATSRGGRARVAGLMAVASAAAGLSIWGWLALASPGGAVGGHAADVAPSPAPPPSAPEPIDSSTTPAVAADPPRPEPAAPTTAAADTPARTPARPIRKLDCDPPFVMKNGIKEFKKQCL